MLADILKRARGGEFADREGEFHLVPASEMQGIKALLRAARGAHSQQRMPVVRAVLDNLDVNSVAPDEWLKVFAGGNEAP